MRTAPHNLVLVGFMATGKTTVGRRLAARLGWRFIDTDVRIEAIAGCRVPEIFARDGEGHFRELETRVAREVARERGAVIATGGGILSRAENVAALRAAGPIVCLTAAPEVILRRAGDLAGRPLLARAPDPLAEIRRLLAERASQYALADHTIDTSELTVDEVVEHLCRVLPSLSPERLTRSSSGAA